MRLSVIFVAIRAVRPILCTVNCVSVLMHRVCLHVLLPVCLLSCCLGHWSANSRVPVGAINSGQLENGQTNCVCRQYSPSTRVEARWNAFILFFTTLRNTWSVAVYCSDGPADAVLPSCGQ